MFAKATTPWRTFHQSNKRKDAIMHNQHSEQNRKLMQDIFIGLEQGNGKPFIDCLAEDFCWIIMGNTAWSGTYRGKQAVQQRLLQPLFTQFAERYTNRALRIIADGEYVAVECRGKVTTRSGKAYNNAYCWVCRIADGQLLELTEYMDTELVTSALTAPQ
jgi:ketosteroid isomerase-like protein